MTSRKCISALVSAALVWTAVGCHAPKSDLKLGLSDSLKHYQGTALKLEEVEPDLNCHDPSLVGALPPQTLDSALPPQYWDLPLEEAMRLALENSQVLRDLGGAMLRSPGTLRTVHGPAIVETDPRFGVDAALSAFDASFAMSTFFDKNDRALNNSFLGGGTRLLTQDTMVFREEITKVAATGTRFTARHNTDYDANNAPANRFPSAWNTNLEAEFRHPLLQGGGVNFNRISGPNGVPGLPLGVLIARVNTDISLAEFEQGLPDLTSNVENAYWDLYYAYRDLDARIAARNRSLETWRRVAALNRTNSLGGEAEKEAQAREQYFRFEEEVQNALTGRLLDGTRTLNGSSGGTFRGSLGVHVAERRLRLLIGLPISDGRWIRPADEPLMARVQFEWEQSLPEAIMRRPELRRQRWIIKRRELELLANRNFLMPRFDAVGRYRFRGFGNDLIDPTGENVPFDNAWENLTTGDFQEWQLGAELAFPFGQRRAHAAVRNAQLFLARERAVLREQEREIVHDLANAIAEKDRAYRVAQTNFNRRLAARQQLLVLENKVQNELQVDLNSLLDAQRRLAEADSKYYFSLVEYAVAVKNIHYEKGSLLDYNNVFLAEGPWPGRAYQDAAQRDSLKMRPGPMNYIMQRPLNVSAGPTPQLVNPPRPATGTKAGLSPMPQQVPGGPAAGATQPNPSVGASAKRPAPFVPGLYTTSRPGPLAR